MSTNIQQLQPPNPQARLLMSGHAVQATGRASSHDSIVTAYAHGISFIDQLGAMAGFLSLVAIWGAMIPVLLTLDAYRDNTLPVAGPLMLAICFFMLRADNVAFKYQPVMFDRASQKIHVFVDLGAKWWKVWQFVPDSRIDTWDWACARAEIVEFTMMTNNGAARVENGLVMAITDRPQGTAVLARFGVGLSSSHDSGRAMIERWEHVRRFMHQDGPHLAQGDRLFHDPSTGGIWAALTWGQPLIGPGSKENWTGSSLKGMWFLTIPFGVLMVGFLPFTVISGLIRLVLYKLKPAPAWPKEILAAVGPALPVAGSAGAAGTA